jgi:hypothetical protein
MNKKLYRSKMALYGDTNESIARALGISPQRNSAKVNGTHGAEYTTSEIMVLKARWKLTAKEVDSIFFAKSVS